MTWIDCLYKSNGIKAIYGSALPTLDSVRLHTVRLHRDYAVSIQFDLSEYPSSPPAKWSKRGLNTVQIELCLSDIESLLISEWSSQMCVDLDIQAVPDSTFRVSCAGTPKLEIVARWIHLSKITAYQASSRPQ